MSNTANLRPGGSVVCWDIAPASNWKRVFDAVTLLGDKFAECQPSPRSIPAAFQAAVAETIQPTLKGHKILVRPVKGTGDEARKHFVVVDEDPELKGDDRFTIVNRCSVSKVEVSPEQSVCWEEIVKFELPVDEDVELAVRETFESMRRTLSAAAVGTTLADIVERMGGVPLRDRGGTYWLPAELNEVWELFSQLIERAATNSEPDPVTGKKRVSKIYGMHVTADEGMVECVGDQMQKSIAAKLDEFKADLANENVRSATVTSRREKVEELRRQSQNFASAFRRKLEGLDAAFAEVDTLLATYGFLESAVNEREYQEQEEAAKEGGRLAAVA